MSVVRCCERRVILILIRPTRLNYRSTPYCRPEYR